MLSSTTSVIAAGSTATLLPLNSMETVVLKSNTNLTNILVDNTTANVVFVKFTTGTTGNVGGNVSLSQLPDVVANVTCVPVPGNSSRIVAGGLPRGANTYANVAVYGIGASTVFVTPVA